MSRFILANIVLLICMCITACVSKKSLTSLDQKPTQASAITVSSAQAVNVISRSVQAFSNELVTDILFDDVEEGYRFSRVGVFGDSFSLAVWKKGGNFSKTILYGLPVVPVNKEGRSSAFGEEVISTNEYTQISKSFSALKICNMASDVFDINTLGDGAILTFEAVASGKYCFAWKYQSDKSDFNGAPTDMIELFKINPDLGY